MAESESSPEPPIASDWGFQLFHGDETGPPEDIPDAVAPTRRAITHPFASDADWNLVQFVGNHDSMPTGMLQELLRIFAMGGLTFRTTYDLFNQVDDLPGVPFESCTAFLDPIPGIEWVSAHGPRVDYTVFKRSIVDLLKSCLADEAATFLNPTLNPEPNPAPTHLTEAATYQRLLAKLRKSTGQDDAVLLPILLHSGVHLTVVYDVLATVPSDVLSDVPL